MKIRIFGLLLLLGGGWMAHLAIWSPMQAMARGAEVSMYYKTAVFAPMILIVGAGFLLGGPRFQQWISNDDPNSKLGKTSLAGWILLGVLLAAGGGVVLWLQHLLRTNGYA